MDDHLDNITIAERITRLEVEVSDMKQQNKDFKERLVRLERKFDMITKTELVILTSVIVNLLVLLLDKII